MSFNRKHSYSHRSPVLHLMPLLSLVSLALAACAQATAESVIATQLPNTEQPPVHTAIAPPTPSSAATQELSPFPIPAATGDEPGDTVTTVSGYVISGGDMTPEGLMDAPRTFIYTIQSDDGSSLDVTYTAFPPSPAGDSAMDKIRLDFHAGSIQINDYLIARGSYDASMGTVTVAEEGDYIETYPEKPQ